MQELNNLLKTYSSKNYTTLIKNRPKLLKFLQGKYGETLSIPEMLWCYANNKTPAVCHCGNIAKFNTFNKGYRKICSAKCKGTNQKIKMTEFWKNNPETKIQMQAKKEKTNLKKYGNKNAALNETVKAKTKATNLVRFGTEYPLQSGIIQDKVKSIIQKNYGVDFPFQSAEIIKKSHNTTIERYGELMSQARVASYAKYGGINPFASSEVKEKIKHTMDLKYGYNHALQSHYTTDQLEIIEDRILFQQAINGLTISEAALKIGVHDSTIARRVIQYNCKDSARSKWECKMVEFLEKQGLRENKDFIRNDRAILNGKELDFYFPKLNFAIEVGSIFWHSELSAGRTRHYHYNKWKECKEQNITLVQYWDHEMINHWPVIESKIHYLLGKISKKVGGRKIQKIEKISRQDERNFLNTNHLQGQTNGSSLRLGAYFDNELVAVMTFIKRKDGTELTRYATVLDTVFSGLFSKMMKQGIAHLALPAGTTIISYSDNRHGNGNVYRTNNFKQLNTPRSAYYYTLNYHTLENQKKFTKSKIAKKFNYDMTDKTEWQAMQELGYDRIWDSGKIKWGLTVIDSKNN